MTDHPAGEPKTEANPMCADGCGLRVKEPGSLYRRGHHPNSRASGVLRASPKGFRAVASPAEPPRIGGQRMSDSPTGPRTEDDVRCLECGDALRLDELSGHLYAHGIVPPWEAAAPSEPPRPDPDVRGSIQHAIDALDEVHDLAEQGDAIESAMLECHATLSTLLDRLGAAAPSEPHRPLGLNPVEEIMLNAIRYRAQEPDVSYAVVKEDLRWLLSRIARSAAPSGQPLDVPDMSVLTAILDDVPGRIRDTLHFDGEGMAAWIIGQWPEYVRLAESSEHPEAI